MASAPDPQDDLTRVTTYTYDGSDLGAPPTGVTTYAFDALDGLISVRYPNGRTTWTVYDADGRVIDRGAGPPDPGTPPDEPPDEPHIVG